MTDVLIMICKDGFYPIQASGKKPIKEEAIDHLALNKHVLRVEDANGTILANRN